MISEEMITTTLASSRLKETSMHVMNSIVISYQLFDPQVSKLVRMIPRMSLAELSEATANFNTDNVIGLGEIGMMYKGVLSNGRPFAIKRLHDSQTFEKQFASELKALGRVRHKNIVPLLGYCIEGKEKLLVYKYISNGNL